MERLSDRRILVTGAASGIGRATALRLLEEGARVAAADVSEDGLEETKARAEGDRLTVHPVDVSDEASVDRAVAGVVAMLVSDDASFVTGTEIRVDGGAHQ